MDLSQMIFSNQKRKNYPVFHKKEAKIREQSKKTTEMYIAEQCFSFLLFFNHDVTPKMYAMT